MTDDFTGKRVLVTGAAKGIGLATAKLLAERGAEVIAFDRSVVDLGDVEATRIAVREVLPIDMLVNCAGIVELESFLETSAETFDRTMAINTRAPLVVAQEVARDLVRRGSPGPLSTCRVWRPPWERGTTPPTAHRRRRWTPSRGSWRWNWGRTASASTASIPS